MNCIPPWARGPVYRYGGEEGAEELFQLASELSESGPIIQLNGPGMARPPKNCIYLRSSDAADVKGYHLIGIDASPQPYLYGVELQYSVAYFLNKGALSVSFAVARNYPLEKALKRYNKKVIYCADRGVKIVTITSRGV